MTFEQEWIVLEGCPFESLVYSWVLQALKSLLGQMVLVQKPFENLGGLIFYLHPLNGSTLPPNVIVTNLHPDVVFIGNNTMPLTCAIYELSVSFQTNISSEKGTNSSHGNPTLKHVDSNVPFVCGSRGFNPQHVKLLLCQMLKTYFIVKVPTS